MTLVVSVHILTCSSVLAGGGIALVDPGLAVAACESMLTSAFVAVDSVHADAAVHARTGSAVLVVSLTIGSRESQRTGACVRVDIVRTGGSVLAGIGATFIQVLGAILSAESRHAEAAVVTSLVQACATVDAGRAGAVVSVDQAIPTFKSASAVAGVAAVGVDASGSVPAGGGDGALVNILAAEPSSESKRTSTGKVSVVHVGAASGSVAALVRNARIHLLFTGLAGVRRLADTLETVDVIDACASVSTRLGLAVVDVGLAVYSSKSGGTGAAVPS